MNLVVGQGEVGWLKCQCSISVPSTSLALLAHTILCPLVLHLWRHWHRLCQQWLQPLPEAFPMVLLDPLVAFLSRETSTMNTSFASSCDIVPSLTLCTTLLVLTSAMPRVIPYPTSTRSSPAFIFVAEFPNSECTIVLSASTYIVNSCIPFLWVQAYH